MNDLPDSNRKPSMTPRWNTDGLIPAIAQDAATGDVLMLAWMNADALAATLSERRAVYWSRSRQCMWRKGESSGNVQELVDIKLDCDGDTFLVKVNQIGGRACHTGRRHCFFYHPEGDQWCIEEAVSTTITSPEVSL